jgi:2-polyprenyl-6-methoxyphenol hydroxylase-like FAD-dependent oxidoreductase
VTFETGREIVSASEGRLTSADGRVSAAFDLIIDATGARSPSPKPSAPDVRSWAGPASGARSPGPGIPFDEGALEQVYRGASKMIGVLPCGACPDRPDQRLATFFWSLKGDDHPAWRADGLDPWKAEILSLWPEVAPLLETITDPTP